MIRTLTYPLHDLLPYIDWLYFFHAWGMSPRFATISGVHDCVACRKSWVERFPESERAQAVEADKLYRDAVRLLRSLDGKYEVKARFGLFPAWSEGDDIVVLVSHEMGNLKEACSSSLMSCRRIHLPFLRQQKQKQTGDPFLCLSDFIAPFDFYYAKHQSDEVPLPERLPRGTFLGIFASAVDENMESLFQEDEYNHLLLQTLCDRLAEAATERMHEEVRRVYWGYAKDEIFSPNELFAEKYQGRRPAVGYPSIPDQSFNFRIDELIDMKRIGIHLTDNGMMKPHAAVSGLMFDHPAARHFSVGSIGEDQLQDYARRSHRTVEDCRKFLLANLGGK